MQTQIPPYTVLLQLLRFQHARHTDATGGINTHFVARMRAGQARFVLPGEEMQVEKGDVFYLPLGLRYHSYWQTDESGEVCWDSFGFSFFPLPAGARVPMQKIPASPAALALFDLVAAEGEQISCMAVSQLYALLASLLPDMRMDLAPVDPLLELAATYMAEHTAATVPETARHLGVSESALYALFRAAGTTPVRLRHRNQIRRAVRLLLSTDLAAEEIAELCGFGSATYFLRVLRQETGKTTRGIREGRMP